MPLSVSDVVQVLVQQHNRLFAYAWSIVGDAQLAEDALQELSVLAVEKGVEVADETRLVVWLWRAAKLKALEMRRDKLKHVTPFDDAVAEELAAHWLGRPAPTESRTIEALRACIEQLAPSGRELLALRYMDGKKSAEIAASSGRKTATVYQSIARLHRSLRTCIEKRLAEGSL